MKKINLVLNVLLVLLAVAELNSMHRPEEEVEQELESGWVGLGGDYEAYRRESAEIEFDSQARKFWNRVNQDPSPLSVLNFSKLSARRGWGLYGNGELVNAFNEILEEFKPYARMTSDMGVRYFEPTTSEVQHQTFKNAEKILTTALNALQEALQKNNPSWSDRDIQSAISRGLYGELGFPFNIR